MNGIEYGVLDSHLRAVAFLYEYYTMGRGLSCTEYLHMARRIMNMKRCINALMYIVYHQYKTLDIERSTEQIYLMAGSHQP